MSLPLQIRTDADRQYVNAFRAAFIGQRLYHPSYALSQDPDIERKLLRDPHTRHLIDHRSRLVAGREWRVVAGDEEDPKSKLWADIDRDALTYIRRFTMARQSMASSGIFWGRGFRFIESQRRSVRLSKLTPMSWRLPIHLKHLDHRRIEYRPEWQGEGESRRVVVHSYLWPIDFKHGAQPNRLEKQDEHALIRVKYGDEEERLGYGDGLMDPLYFCLYAKWQLLQEGLRSAETWARGLPVAKVDAEAKGRKGKTSADIATEFLNLFDELAARYGIAIDKRDDVNVLWPSGSGWQLIIELIRYFNQEADRLVLSSELPTGGGDSSEGSYARSQTEQDSMDALIQGDRDVLDEALTENLLGWFHRENWGNLVALGVTGSREPRFVTGDEQRRDSKEGQEVLATALDHGMDVETEEAYDLLGLTPPKSAPPIIKGRQPMENPASPFGSFAVPGAEKGGPSGEEQR